VDEVINRAALIAEQALREARERASRQGWDEERVEREKARLGLQHDVTLCATPGCLGLASGVPGFRDLLCPSCSSVGRTGGASL